MCYKSGVSILWELMPDDLRWSWYNNNGNKVHSKCTEFKSSWTPCSLQKNFFRETSAKKVGDHRYKLFI